MSKFLVFLIFLLAPLSVLVIVTKSYADDPTIGALNNEVIIKDEIVSIDSKLNEMSVNLTELSIKMTDISEVAKVHEETFATYTETIDNSIEISKDQKYLSDDIYERRITNALGEPIDFYLSDNSEIKIFELKELGYRGYIAKIKLFDPEVFKVELAEGEMGKLETTSEAAERVGAVLGINGGGFGVGRVDGELFSEMIGGTVIDGELVNNFIRAKDEDLFFVGINKSGDLVGNIPETSYDIMKLGPYQGVSFIPILIRFGMKIKLPNPWVNTKHPRTIIGQYANDDIILIVVDGRQGEWSSGISLERLQDKLLELGVKNAYNLDGGGSTVMYFKGEILNKPSDGHERPVANSILILP